MSASVAIAALVVLSAREWHGTTGGGGGGPQLGGFSFTANGWQSWAPTTFVLLGAGLLVASAGLWAARSRRMVTFAAALALGCLGGAAWTVSAAQGWASLSGATYRAVPIGISRAALESRLGPPWTTQATLSRPSGRVLGCDVYGMAGWPATEHQFVFCFRDGALAVKFAN